MKTSQIFLVSCVGASALVSAAPTSHDLKLLPREHHNSTSPGSHELLTRNHGNTTSTHHPVLSRDTTVLIIGATDKSHSKRSFDADGVFERDLIDEYELEARDNEAYGLEARDLEDYEHEARGLEVRVDQKGFNPLIYFLGKFNLVNSSNKGSEQLASPSAVTRDLGDDLEARDFEDYELDARDLEGYEHKARDLEDYKLEVRDDQKGFNPFGYFLGKFNLINDSNKGSEQPAPPPTVTRDLEDDLEARDFGDHELDAREFGNYELDARDLSGDELEVRDFDDYELDARELDDYELDARHYDEADLYGREFELDELD
ncbi:hypothetical protein H0H87_006546 [Tephrocybe sp. NHM501043]|nr:hypothetical protein H0H87_006546 [Tephrocybe sp. NHM501043]